MAPKPSATGLHVLQNFAAPCVVGQTITHPTEVPALLKPVRGNAHSKAGLEAAVWDAFAKANDMRLADLFASCLPEGHQSRNKAVVGVSIGIMPPSTNSWRLSASGLHKAMRGSSSRLSQAGMLKSLALSGAESRI